MGHDLYDVLGRGIAAGVCLLALGACTTANPNACHSHWTVVGRAQTRAGLLPQLRHQVSKRFSLGEFQKSHSGWHLDAVDRHHHVVARFEVFRQHGSWVAREWAQCTD